MINSGVESAQIIEKFGISAATLSRLRKLCQPPQIPEKEVLLPERAQEKSSVIEEKKSETESYSKEGSSSGDSTEGSEISSETEASSSEQSSEKTPMVSKSNSMILTKEEEEKPPLRCLTPKLRDNSPVRIVRNEVLRNLQIMNTKAPKRVVKRPKNVDSSPRNKKISNDISTDPDMRQKKILQIRNYINCFEDQLKSVYVTSKEKFFKSLHSKGIPYLDTVLEEIRVELSVSQHLDTFVKMFNMTISLVEKASSFLGVDVNGLVSEVESDPNFEKNIKILACEFTIDLSARKQIAFRIVRAFLLRYQMNQMKGSQQISSSEVTKIMEKYKDI